MEAPAANGRPITGYTVTTDPGDQVCESTELVCVVDGLSEDEKLQLLGPDHRDQRVGHLRPVRSLPGAAPRLPGTPRRCAGTPPRRSPSRPRPPAVPRAVTSSQRHPAERPVPSPNSGGPLTCAVPGLTNGVAYTFTATADNDGGTSEPSSASTPVTPIAPAHDPVFADELTRTATGFTVRLENFAADDPSTGRSPTPPGARRLRSTAADW